MYISAFVPCSVGCDHGKALVLSRAAYCLHAPHLDCETSQLMTLVRVRMLCREHILRVSWTVSMMRVGVERFSAVAPEGSGSGSGSYSACHHQHRKHASWSSASLILASAHLSPSQPISAVHPDQKVPALPLHYHLQHFIPARHGVPWRVCVRPSAMLQVDTTTVCGCSSHLPAR